MKVVLIGLLLPVMLFAQYWGERVTEKSFEHSNLYFQSYYLNPYGIYNFKKVSAGLIDDPFLQIHLNPAYIPLDTSRFSQLYVDFRGDRKEAPVTHIVPLTPYRDYGGVDSYTPIYIDPRWYSVTRPEPEPIVSFGYLSHPRADFFLAATFQFLYKEEPYYQTPTWIYQARYGMDYAGEKLVADSNVPIINRSAGEDNMITRGQLFSVNLAYRILPGLEIGGGVNGVFHKRSGAYARLHQDEYSTQETHDWMNTYSKERNNDYHHWDMNGGLTYHLSHKMTVGIKLGWLTGRADQTYVNRDSSVYDYQNQNGNNEGESHSFRNGHTNQSWNHDGQDQYGTLLLKYRINEKRKVQFYFTANQTTIDIANRSVIRDTSYYNGHWNSSNYFSQYDSWNSLNDRRHAAGSSDIKAWQMMFSYIWQETARSKLFLGLYFNDYRLHTRTTEPVMFNSASYYHSIWQSKPDDLQSYISNYSRHEDKSLVWDLHTTRQSFQIPVMLQYRFAKSWTLMLVVNRYWRYWQIKDQTTAYFKVREKNNNGKYEKETDFGERYTQPTRTISEDGTDILAGLMISVSQNFHINLFTNPDWHADFFMSQWWLSFKINL